MKASNDSHNKGRLTDSTIVTFREDGRLDSVVRYGTPTTLDGEKLYLCSEDKEIYHYIDNMSICEYYKYGDYDGKKVLYYNDCGEVKTEIGYDNSGDESYKHEYVYNDKNQLIESSLYMYDGLMEKCKNYEYNEKGLLIKYCVYDDEDKLTRAEYFCYDNEGRKIKEFCKVEDEYISRWRAITYNPEGYIATSEFENKYMHHKAHITYEYDDRGNYIKKDNRIERVIVYY